MAIFKAGTTFSKPLVWVCMLVFGGQYSSPMEHMEIFDLKHFRVFFWENAKETAAPAKPTPKSQTKAMWNQSPRGFLAFYFWVMFFWVGGSSQSEYYARQFFG